jgi:hypothetical protein
MITTLTAFSTEDEVRFIMRHASRLAFPYTLTPEQKENIARFLRNCRTRLYDISVNAGAINDLVHALEVSHGLD